MLSDAVANELERASHVLPAAVSAWISGRRARRESPEDVLADLGLCLASEASESEEERWLRVAYLVAECRSLCRPRSRPASAGDTTATDAARILAGASAVLVLVGADASASSGVPCFPSPAGARPVDGSPNLFERVAARHGLATPERLFEMSSFVIN